MGAKSRIQRNKDEISKLQLNISDMKLTIDRLTRENAEKQSTIDSLTSQVKSLESKNSTLKKDLQKLKDAYEKLTKDYVLLENELHALKAKLFSLGMVNDTLRDEKARLEDALANLERQVNEIQDANDQLKRDLESMPTPQEILGQQQSMEHHAQIDQIGSAEETVSQQEYDELKALLDALKAAKADVEKERDNFQQEHILLHKKISKLEVDLEGAGNKRDEYKRLLTEAERRIRELEGINARFTDREKELQEELLSVHNEVSGLQQQIILLKIRLSKAEADRGNFEDKIDKLNKEINDLHQRLSQI